MSATVSSYIPTSGGTDTRTIEALSYSLGARPQAMTFYARFIELGTVITQVPLLHIGTAVLNATPELRIDVSASAYSIFFHNGTSSSRGTLAAAPSVGDVVELVGHLNADGSIQILQSVNGAATTETTLTAALAMPALWAPTTLLFINSVGTTVTGLNAFMNVVIYRGVHSLSRMRRFAGVKQ